MWYSGGPPRGPSGMSSGYGPFPESPYLSGPSGRHASPSDLPVPIYIAQTCSYFESTSHIGYPSGLASGPPSAPPSYLPNLSPFFQSVPPLWTSLPPGVQFGMPTIFGMDCPGRPPLDPFNTSPYHGPRPQSLNSSGPSYSHNSPSAPPSAPPSPLRQGQIYPPHSSSTSIPCLPLGELLVTVVKARGIKGDESRGRGKGDHFAIIKLGGNDWGGEPQQTVRCDAGSNPEWKQRFTFYVRKEDAECNKLIISLYNRNSLRQENFLGRLKILNMGEFMSEKRVPEAWYPVILNGTKRGEILLSFHMLPMSATEMLQLNAFNPPVSAPSASSGGTRYRIVSYKKGANLLQVLLQGAAVIIAVIALL